MKAAYLSSYSHVNNYNVIDVEQILQDIKNNKFKPLIDRLPTYGTKEYSDEKRKLPAWSFAGTYNGRIANADFLESNGLFHIDIDGLDDVAYSKKWLIQSIPELVALWVSPSQHGLKGLIRVQDGFIKNDSDYKAAFVQIEQYFTIHGFTIDPSCKDVRRLCFVCADSDIFINLQANPFLFSDRKEIPVKKQPGQPGQVPGQPGQKYISRAVSIIMGAGKGGYHGARLAAGKLAGGFISGGLVVETDIVLALEKASDYICSQFGDDELTVARERKAIMDGIESGRAIPCDPDRPRTPHAADSIDYSTMPDYQQSYFDQTTGQQYYQEQPKEQPKEINPFKFISINDLLSREYKPNWLVKGLFERNSMGLLFGNSASGKSLIVQDLAWCLANGFDFKGHKISDNSKVVYICGEGFYGLMKRFRALQHYYGGNADNLIISEQPAAFMDLSSAAAVCDAITEWGGCDLIVIDTFHRNMGAGDENSAKDFAQFLSNIDNFIKPFGATILIIHHSGHDAKERSRGSSAIRASMDFEYRMHKDEDLGITELKNTKMKDYEPPAAMSFKFLPVDINLRDDDGDDVMGVVLESTEESVSATVKRPLDTLSKNVLSSLYECFRSHSVKCPNEIKTYFNRSPENAPASVVHIDDFRLFAYPFYNVSEDSKRKSLKRTIEKLELHGKCKFYNGFLWIC